MAATIANSGSAGADTLDYTGLGVTASGGTLSGTTASGSALAVGRTGSGSQTFASAIAGSFTLTPVVASAVNTTLGGSALLSQVVPAVVNVYRLAAAGTPNTVYLGDVHAGGVSTRKPLIIQNLAANDGYSESLDVSFGSASGGATTNGGSISLLAAGATDSSSLVVGLGGSNHCVARSSQWHGKPGADLRRPRHQRVGADGIGHADDHRRGKCLLRPGAVEYAGIGYMVGQRQLVRHAGQRGRGLARPFRIFGRYGHLRQRHWQQPGHGDARRVSDTQRIDVGQFGRGLYVGRGGHKSIDFGERKRTATITVLSGTHVISAPLSLASSTSIVPVAGAQLTISGNIGGSSGLSLDGAGTLILSGSNTYTGGTTVNTGTLIFASSQAIGGSGASIIANAGATVAAGYPLDQNFLNSFASACSGVIALAANSGNDLDFSAFASLRLGAVGSATYSGTLTPNSATYRLGGGAGTLTVTGPLTGPNGLDVNTNGTQPGSVILAGATTYTGPTQVSGGTLIVQGGNSSSAFTANNGGTLQFSGVTVNLGSAYVQALTGGLVQYQGASITGGFIRGPASQVLEAGAANSFNGTTIDNGAVIQQNGIANFTDVTNAGQIGTGSNAVLTWQGGTNASSGVLTVNNAATVNVSEWYNDGFITINNGGSLNNSVSNLVSGGGSEILVNSGGTLNVDSNAQGVTLNLPAACSSTTASLRELPTFSTARRCRDRARSVRLMSSTAARSASLPAPAWLRPAWRSATARSPVPDSLPRQQRLITPRSPPPAPPTS